MRLILLALCVSGCIGEDQLKVTQGGYVLAIDAVPFWNDQVLWQELRLEQYGEVHGWGCAEEPTPSFCPDPRSNTCAGTQLSEQAHSRITRLLNDANILERGDGWVGCDSTHWNVRILSSEGHYNEIESCDLVSLGLDEVARMLLNAINTCD